MQKWPVFGTCAWMLFGCGADGSGDRDPFDVNARDASLEADVGEQRDGAADAAGEQRDARVGEADGGGAGPACGPLVEQAVEVTSAQHVAAPITYPDPPPAGGQHNPCWGTWGVHERELEDDRFVHNLEHGGVVFLYNCPGGCAAEIEALRAIVQARDLAIVTPYAALPTRFGVVSWGYRMLSDCFDRASFERFYVEHRDHGLEQYAGNPDPSCR